MVEFYLRLGGYWGIGADGKNDSVYHLTGLMGGGWAYRLKYFDFSGIDSLSFRYWYSGDEYVNVDAVQLHRSFITPSGNYDSCLCFRTDRIETVENVFIKPHLGMVGYETELCPGEYGGFSCRRGRLAEYHLIQ